MAYAPIVHKILCTYIAKCRWSKLKISIFIYSSHEFLKIYIHINTHVWLFIKDHIQLYVDRRGAFVQITIIHKF